MPPLPVLLMITPSATIEMAREAAASNADGNAAWAVDSDIRKREGIAVGGNDVVGKGASAGSVSHDWKLADVALLPAPVLICPATKTRAPMPREAKIFYASK